jgi:hypothetical protein
MATYAEAKAMLRIHAKRLLGYENVVAVALGRKNGDRSRRDWCIRVHVSAKSPRRTKSSVPARLLPPRRLKWLRPVPTDVEQVGKLELHQGVGAGTGLDMDEKGTCAVVLKDGNLYYALTCGHVASNDLTGRHDLSYGYLDSDQLIDCCLLNDQGRDVRGTVGQCVRCSSKQAPIDLALVQLDSAACEPQSSPAITGIRSLSRRALEADEPITVLRRADHGGPYTTSIPGELDHYVTASFDYDTTQGKQSVIYDGLICYPARNGADTLAAGDSGSAVVDAQGRLIGIHMGASSDADNPLGYGISSDQLTGWAPTLTLV